MKQSFALLAVATVALAACRAQSKSQGMPGMAEMTPEEHARMTGAAPAGESTSAREPVRLTAAQARAIGVTYAEVQRGPLVRAVRTVGQITPAESRLADVTSKIDGFIDELFVAATGQQVQKGQPLLTLYSPALVAAQEELLLAKRLAAALHSADAEAWRNAQAMVEAARRRLLYWDISPDQIEQLERSGQVTKALTLTAPFDGVVLDKTVVTGQSVMSGMKLYRLADLSTVWIEGEVFAQDLALVPVGSSARVELSAYPGRSFRGRVGFVSPVLDEESRTARVRVSLRNVGGLLKPGIYATLFFEAKIGADVLSVPAEAVVMTGERNLVFVVGVEGALEPREVTLGARAGDRLQIVGGLEEGERIVASANFLVDAESRLGTGKSGIAPMPGMEGMEVPSQKKKQP